MSLALISALSRLLESDDGVSVSKLSLKQRQALEEFKSRTHAIAIKRKGRGISYCVSDQIIVEQQLKSLSPDWAQGAMLAAPQRAQNISRTRSSKIGRHQHDYVYMLLRSVHPGTSWQNAQGLILDMYAETRRTGAITLMIGNPLCDDWHTHGELWLIENQALFDDLSWLPKRDVSTTVLWYRGQLPKLLIQWLSKKQRASKVILFPDYDGVGLHNYVRLRRSLGEQCEFWLMPNWQEKLLKYGDNLLWQNSKSDLEAALSFMSMQHQLDLLALIKMMQHSGLALEQEVVFL